MAGDAGFAPLMRALEGLREPLARAGYVLGGDHTRGRVTRAVVGAAVFFALVQGLFDPPTVTLVVGTVLVAALAGTWEFATKLPRIGAALPAVAFAIAAYTTIKAVWNPPDRLVVYGLAVGSLYGLLAMGIVLIYRSNKIVNFAAGSLGAMPGVVSLTLLTAGFAPGFLHREQGDALFHLNFFLALPLAVFGGAIIGALVDLIVIRRFATAPRLILTVVTIGVSQLLAYMAFFSPRWLGARLLPDVIRTPLSSFKFCLRDESPGLWNAVNRGCYELFHADDFDGDLLFTFGVVIAVAAGLGAFFKYTKIGIAVRASAENADRASLLGIPVRRVGTVAWTIAGMLAALTIFLRGPLVGLPLGGLAGPTILLFALTAAVIGRMESMPIALGAGMFIGVIDQSSVFATGRPSLGAAIMLLIILVALLVQRSRLSRAYDAGTSTWQMVKEFRPIPIELRRVREVVIGRTILGLLVAAFFLCFPFIAGEAFRAQATLVVIFAIVGISLVILTGWAGQISLGQFGFVGAGAAVAGGLVANHNADFFVALAAGGLAGVVVAILIGLPALRVQGLFLAVATLAFGAAMEFYFLNSEYVFGRTFLPESGARVTRPMFLNRIDLTSETSFYYFCLAFLALAVLCARAFRRNRSGRVLIAVRDNHRAASSYAMNLARSRLAAFAISGFFAAIAGVLMAYELGAIDAGTFGARASLEIFAVTVVGGISSIMGAVLGAVVIQGIKFLEGRYSALQDLSLLVTGPGLVIVLMFLPGGFAEGLYKTRDNFLRWVAKRHDILVPSLLADKRVVTGEEEEDVLTEAERHVEEAEHFDEVLAKTGRGADA